MAKKKRNKNAAETRQFEINTGDIFLSVLERWEKYDRHFLKKDLHDALIVLLGNNKIFTSKYDKANDDYFKRYAEETYPQAIESSKDKNNFPFPNFFLKQHKNGDPYDSIVSFSEPFIVERSSSYYDLFFALRLTTIDMMKVDQMLDFHLKLSFSKNWSKYSDFLTKLKLKYDQLLAGNFSTAIENYIKKKEGAQQTTDKPPVKPQKDQTTTDTDSTTARQVLAFHFLFQELGVSPNSIDKTEIARFIIFLTGKRPSGDVRDTNVYKRLKKLLNPSDKAVLRDLHTIRPYFEKLNLSGITTKINNEINTRQDQ